MKVEVLLRRSGFQLPMGPLGPDAEDAQKNECRRICSLKFEKLLCVLSVSTVRKGSANPKLRSTLLQL